MRGSINQVKRGTLGSMMRRKACSFIGNAASGGFSLLELMFAITILALIASVAVPNYGPLVKESRVRAQASALVNAIELARSSAVARRTLVVFCASADASTCSGDTGDWSTGWVVRDTAATAVNPVLQAGKVLADGATVTTLVHTVTFDSFGETGTSAQLKVKPGDCVGTDARLIDIVTTGLVNVQKATC